MSLKDRLEPVEEALYSHGKQNVRDGRRIVEGRPLQLYLQNILACDACNMMEVDEILIQ